MDDLVRRAREVGGFSPEAELCSKMADEIERLREALRYYANRTQAEWVNVTGADDGVVARAALGGEE